MGLVKNWLAGMLKGVAVAVIQKEGDLLQERLKQEVAGESDSSRLCDKLDRVIDEAQRRTQVLVASRGPAWAFLQPIRVMIGDAIKANGDKLQAELRAEIKANGPKAIDAIFDRAQALLIQRVQAIVL